MNKKLTSPLADEMKLRNAIAVSQSAKDVLQHLGLRAAGGNYAQLRKYCVEFGIDLPKYDKSLNGRTENLVTPRKFSDSEIFVENSTYSNGANIKKRLYSMGVEEKCTECGLGAEWNGKPISLQLEHINGVHSDNRLENLTILYPNCHSQTPTFAGRKVKELSSPPNKVVSAAKTNTCKCGTKILDQSKSCSKCSNSVRYQSDSKYPDLETLMAMVDTNGYTATGLQLGVSDNAIRKRIKKLSDA